MAKETTKVAPATKVKAKKEKPPKKSKQRVENTHSYFFNNFCILCCTCFYCSYELV